MSAPTVALLDAARHGCTVADALELCTTADLTAVDALELCTTADLTAVDAQGLIRVEHANRGVVGAHWATTTASSAQRRDTHVRLTPAGATYLRITS